MTLKYSRRLFTVIDRIVDVDYIIDYEEGGYVQIFLTSLQSLTISTSFTLQINK